ncbi:AAA family ATPase [Candidatus Bipolaricaulota bacterium]
MRELVVLVGPPASGKTAVQRSHPEWVVVSKNEFRACMFRALYETADEETVDRVFSAALVEAISSDADVVCVDDLNLSSATRGSLIEMARLSGRRPIAHVMPPMSINEIEAGIRENVHRLRRELPHMKIAGPSIQALELMLANYTHVAVTEGFFDIVLHESADPAALVLGEGDSARPKPRQRRERREPLPLFV